MEPPSQAIARLDSPEENGEERLQPMMVREAKGNRRALLVVVLEIRGEAIGEVLEVVRVEPGDELKVALREVPLPNAVGSFEYREAGA
jgi:hypothetical protein